LGRAFDRKAEDPKGRGQQMCGIAGIVSTELDFQGGAATNRMIEALRHRGPDGEGFWSGRVGDCDVALGHLRLAIIDLTDAGRQPMFLPDGSQGLVFNGEVYNYRELRKELEHLGVTFRTESDTEVVLWALAIWGDEAFKKFNGMWAIAWIDLNNGKMLLSRDRFGIKPLYLYRSGGTLFFASEIKGILAGSGRRFGVNAQAVARFLRQSVLDAQPETFFSEIEALPAGHHLRLTLRRKSGVAEPEAELAHYWSFGHVNGFVSAEERIEIVRETFLDSVRLRLRSDVPVGILLSGGMDSSSIAAAMRCSLGAQADLHAISAVSGHPEYDETCFIDAVSLHLMCPVHYVHLRHDPDRWFDLLGAVVYSNDEPVGSFSPVAHYLLMEEARRLGITVILSGQGGDENLCGYFKFVVFYLQQLSRNGHCLSAIKVLSGFLKNRTVFSQFKMSEAKRYLPQVAKPREIDVSGPRLRDHNFAVETGLGNGSLADRQQTDLESLSVPSLVHYEDRTSMAWSREIRLPFLDYRLVQLLLSLEPEWKIRDGWTKWVFRKAMESYLPKSVVWRKDKQGFTIPQAQWLKHELREKIEHLIDGDMLSDSFGLIERQALKRRYDAYCKQPRDRGPISFKDIFNPLALEIWLRQFEAHLSLN
jgi:asparagine synthase (glutamine-hydrolysing)